VQDQRKRFAFLDKRANVLEPPSRDIPSKQETYSGNMIFRQLFDTTGSSTYTYLLVDEASKEGILIDPVLDEIDRDLRLVEELDVKLIMVRIQHIILYSAV
jgi:glyoxylase-like metal-dependent hydrolase (beta-lactamase superfamily II)